MNLLLLTTVKRKKISRKKSENLLAVKFSLSATRWKAHFTLWLHPTTTASLSNAFKLHTTSWRLAALEAFRRLQKRKDRTQTSSLCWWWEWCFLRTNRVRSLNCLETTSPTFRSTLVFTSVPLAKLLRLSSEVNSGSKSTNGERIGSTWWDACWKSTTKTLEHWKFTKRTNGICKHPLTISLATTFSTLCSN